MFKALSKHSVMIKLGLFLYTLILFWISYDHPFYWDNVVQISVPANFYFTNNFTSFFLPAEIATGHPTFVGMYFALFWKLFGKSLLVSHLAMVPFVYGLLYQLFRLTQNLKIIKTSIGIWVLIAVLFDTTFVSQLSLVSFDIIQLFLFVLCLNELLQENNTRFGLCYLFLLLVSLRATIIGGGLLLFYFIQLKNKFTWNNYLKFIPGILGICLFLLLFKINNGWIIHNITSANWSGANQLASLSQIFKNIIACSWQISDYGRLGLYTILFYSMIIWFRNRSFSNDVSRKLFLIAASQAIVLFPIVILSQNPFGHRYFLPIIIPLSMLGMYVIDHLKYQNVLKTIAILLLISGHFWIYPKKISQGWDSTTLHWNYLDVAEEMHKYIESRSIDLVDVGTFFPAYKSRSLTHLEEEKSEGYSGIPFESRYLLYSNAFNIDDVVIDQLFSGSDVSWKIQKQFSKGGVFINLYLKK